jgi:hypothetical protein
MSAFGWCVGAAVVQGVLALVQLHRRKLEASRHSETLAVIWVVGAMITWRLP